jgi:hypothetical protein
VNAAEDFARRVEAFLERLRHQAPLAIIQYGSSLRPADFVPGQSDLDLIVISHEPLRDVANDLGYSYTFIPPREFISSITAGDMFWLSALQSGQVRHDPQGFLRNLQALAASGLDLSPNLTTIRSCAVLIGTQLESAMSLYFSGPDGSEARILRLLYSAAKGIGGYIAIAATGEDPHGFEGIARTLEAGYPETAALMRTTRERLRQAERFPHVRRPRTHVEDDALGRCLLEVERAYVEGVALVPGRRMTHALIEEYQRGPERLDATLVVRLDNNRHTHFVVGRSGGGYCLFGLSDTRQPQSPFFRQHFPDRQGLESVLGPVALP